MSGQQKINSNLDSGTQLPVPPAPVPGSQGGVGSPNSDTPSFDVLGFDPFAINPAQSLDAELEERLTGGSANPAPATPQADAPAPAPTPAPAPAQPTATDILTHSILQHRTEAQQAEQMRQMQAARTAQVHEFAKAYLNQELVDAVGESAAPLVANILANQKMELMEQNAMSTMRMVQQMAPAVAQSAVQQHAGVQQFHQQYPELAKPEFEAAILTVGQALASQPTWAQKSPKERMDALANSAAAVLGVQLQKPNGGNSPETFAPHRSLGSVAGNGQSTAARQSTVDDGENPFVRIANDVLAWSGGSALG